MVFINIQSTPLEDTAGLANAVNGQKQFGRGRGNSFSQGRGRGNRRYCTFCERTNHTVDTCYKKRGYPPNRGRGGGNSYANMIDGDDADSKIQTASTSRNEESAGVTLTKDQYQNLMSLLEKSNLETKCSANVVKGINYSSFIGGSSCYANFDNKHADTGWIIDTRDTHHTCFDLKWFSNCTKIEPMRVNLPNGNTTLAHCRGQIRLSQELSTDNVLYLPQFAVNLISASKLIKEQNCILHFEANECIIQEKNSLKKIGLAEERHGLYYLKIDEKHNQVSVSNVFASANSNKEHVPDGIMWHLRLGHLSKDRMMCMNKLYSYVSTSPHCL